MRKKFTVGGLFLFLFLSSVTLLNSVATATPAQAVKLLINGGFTGSGVVVAASGEGYQLLLTASHNLGPQRKNEQIGPDVWRDSTGAIGFNSFYFVSDAPGAKTTAAISLYRPAAKFLSETEDVKAIDPVTDFGFLLVSTLEPSENPRKFLGEAAMKPLPVMTPNISLKRLSDPQKVVLVGFPGGGPQTSIEGVVLSTAEASALIAENPDLPAAALNSFDPEQEFLVRAAVSKGMSGGAAFDDSGNLVGIVVRSGKTLGKKTPYSRVLRVETILQKLRSAKFPDKTKPVFESILGSLGDSRDERLLHTQSPAN